jgi:hypothetical protein
VSANKRKGTAWESALVAALSGLFRGRYGLAPRRVAQEGYLDTGDLHGIEPFVGQAKNWRSWEDAIREGLDGAEAQARRAGQPFGVAFVKRVRRSTGAGYAVMTVATFARLLVRLRGAEERLRAADPDAFEAHAAEAATDAEATV